MEIVSSVSNESADWKMAAAAVQELKIKPEPKDSFDGLQLPTEITIYMNIIDIYFILCFEYKTKNIFFVRQNLCQSTPEYTF